MNEFRFNTGVHISNNQHIKGGIDSGNGVVVIPFEADAPKEAKFVYFSDCPDVYDYLDNKPNKLLRCEIKGIGMLSKYGFYYL